jgi:hypothetical protein
VSGLKIKLLDCRYHEKEEKMSEESCTISPDGIRALEICQEVEKSLFEKIDAAINDAAIQNLKALEKEGRCFS